MITLLLLVITLSEVARFVMTHKPISRKAHFKSKLKGVQQMIWDLQFKVYKTQEIREDVRKEYDALQSKIAALEVQIKNFNGKDEDKKTLEDQKVLCERDSERFLAQIKQLDIEINGAAKSQEYPDGASGIVHQIESLRELESMLKDWSKK